MMNNRKQLADYLVIIAFFIVIGLLVFGYAWNWLSLRTLIMVLAIAPLVLVNYFVIKNPERTPKFKWSLGIFSALFIIVFIIAYPHEELPEPGKSGENEFGVLLMEFGHAELKHDDLLQRLAKELGNVKAGGESKTYQTVRIFVDRLDDETARNVKLATIAAVKMDERNARLACFYMPISADSIRERFFVSKNLMAEGFYQENFDLVLHRNQSVETTLDNVKALWEFANGKRYAGAGEVLQQPRIIQMLVSAEPFKQATQKIAQLSNLPSNDPIRGQVVQEAEAALINSTQYDPLNDKAYNMLAWINSSYHKDDVRASEYYQKAQTIQPDKFEYNWNLAQNYHLLRKKDEAIRVLRNYLDTYGKDLEPSNRVAMELLLASYQQK